MTTIFHKAVYGLHVLYLACGSMDYAGFQVWDVDPAVIHAVYIYSFIIYAVAHILVDAIPRLVGSIGKVLHKIWKKFK